MVFLGTITDVLEVRDDRVVRARMRIDRSYKGVAEDSLILFDDGMCDGPELHLGEQYLMYTRPGPDGTDVPSRGCSRSRPASSAEEDLRFLSSLRGSRSDGSIFGKLERPDGEGDRPIAGATVSLRSEAGELSAVTDASGRYSFQNLPRAEYAVSANAPGFRSYSYGSLQADLRDGGCANVDLRLRPDWQGSVRGRLVMASGEPAPSGVELALLRLRQDGDGKSKSFQLSEQARTDETGSYAFASQEPGSYKVAVNLYGYTDERVAFPTVYWPAARAQSEAFVIEVTDTERRCDFSLPSASKQTVVHGIVLGVDGKPQPEVQASLAILQDGDLPYHLESGTTDSSGRFSFTVFEGIRYQLGASARGTASEDRPFVAGAGSGLVTLVLKPFSN